jgi:hypothetical protein
VLAERLSCISFAMRDAVGVKRRANLFCHACHVKARLTEQFLSKRHA